MTLTVQWCLSSEVIVMYSFWYNNETWHVGEMERKRMTTWCKQLIQDNGGSVSANNHIMFTQNAKHINHRILDYREFVSFLSYSNNYYLYGNVLEYSELRFSYKMCIFFAKTTEVLGCNFSLAHFLVWS